MQTSQNNELKAAGLASFAADDGIVMVWKFLRSMWGDASGVTIFYAQENGVPLPPDPSIMINSVWEERLSFNTHDFSVDQQQTIKQQVQVALQLDFFGSGAQSRLSQLSTLWYDAYAFDWFKSQGLPCRPLTIRQLRQVQFINESDNFDQRWTCEITLQIEQSVTISQETAITPGPISLIEVDAGQTTGA